MMESFLQGCVFAPEGQIVLRLLELCRVSGRSRSQLSANTLGRWRSISLILQTPNDNTNAKLADAAENSTRKQSDDVMNLESLKMQYFCKHSVSFWFSNKKNAALLQLLWYTESAQTQMEAADRYREETKSLKHLIMFHINFMYQFCKNAGSICGS